MYYYNNVETWYKHGNLIQVVGFSASELGNCEGLGWEISKFSERYPVDPMKVPKINGWVP